MRVLAISGSFRSDSHNARLLRAAALALPPGVELELYEGLASLPPYCEDADVDPAPAAVEDLRARIAAADALLIATPEYNASIPGVLKNAIDWASRPFPDNALRGKPAAVIGASTGLFGAVWAQADLRKVLRHAGAEVLDAELPVGMADQAFTPTDELADPELGLRLADLMEALGNVREADERVEPRNRTPALRAV
jgi:chromate reductase, NAD(P)H dehydrogenase (quinone)